MGSIIIFFHYKKWLIHWNKKFLKNIHALYSFNHFSSEDIFKHTFQGFWAIQQYFVFEAVFTWNWQIKKYEISLIFVIRLPTRCYPQEATTASFGHVLHKRQIQQVSNDDRNNVCKVLLDLLWVHMLITLGSYLQLLLPHLSLAPCNQKYLYQPNLRIP